MTAQTPDAGQARPGGFRRRMVRYRIGLAVVTHILRDRGFQASAVTGVIAAVALGQLGRDNQVHPVRRLAAWYRMKALAEELEQGAVREIDRAREALEPGER